MLAGLNPQRAPGAFVFCTTDDPQTTRAALEAADGSFREAEGWSFILPVEAAARLGFAVDQPMARITLQVYSALDGLGLTAAVSAALARAGVAVNVVAAFHHDHLFVPLERAEQAVDVLRALQAELRVDGE